MNRISPYLAAFFLVAVGCSAPTAEVDVTELEQKVADVERAFARTMADRDHAAFASFLSEEAVFLAGTTARRGKAAVAGHWQAYFDEPEAPFSWRPETVSVLDSGRLAISTGPVWNAAGERTSTYTSIWRQEEPGVWRIVFDKGERYCDDAAFRAVMAELADAWNRGDAGRAAALFAEDAIYSEPPDKQLYVGRPALYEFFGGDAGREGEMEMVWHHLAFSEKTGVGFGEFSFTYGSSAHGVAVVKLRDGKISNWREYWYESDLPWSEFVAKNPF